tara:strand:+ start:1034 stop:1387 length:354 start_codon:yes stop_codon:yes gene_type:complete
MIRKILAVIAGYAIFVITSLLLFKFSGQDPHEPASTSFKIITLIYGSVFSFASGFLLKLVARNRNLNLNYVLGFIIAGFAAFSITKSTGSHWTQLFAIIFFAPISILGGIYYNKRKR